MKKCWPLLVIALFFAGLSYVIIENLYISIAMLIVFVAALLGSEFFFFSKLRDKETKEKECFVFTRTFLLSLIATNSFEGAYDASLTGASKELLVIAKTGNEKNIDEHLRDFEDYFESDYYGLFLSILKVYEIEGGEIAVLAEPFLLEATEREKDVIRREAARKKSLVEFSTLLFLGTLIMAFLRYGLSGFYDELINNVPYVFCSTLYFLFIAISIVIFAAFSTGVKFSFKKKEAKNEKK